MTLEVPAGATVALGGALWRREEHGSPSLIPRFWDPTGGHGARWRRADVRAVPTAEPDGHAWPSCSRTTACSRARLADNIRAGAPRCDATRRCARLPQAAQCADIIAKLPQGLDTVVGADGSVPVRRRVPAHRVGPGHFEGRAHGGARRGHGVRRPGKRGAHPAGACGRLTARQDGAHDRAPALHGGGRRRSSLVLDGGRASSSAARTTSCLAAGGLYARMWADYRARRSSGSIESGKVAPAMLRECAGPYRAGVRNITAPGCGRVRPGESGAHGCPWASCSMLVTGEFLEHLEDPAPPLPLTWRPIRCSCVAVLAVVFGHAGIGSTDATYGVGLPGKRAQARSAIGRAAARFSPSPSSASATWPI